MELVCPMNVSLTPELEKLVKDQVDSGLYNNASEVVREALRLMKIRNDAYKAKLKRLRTALAKGEKDIAAGRYTEIKTKRDLDRFFADL